MSKCLVCAFPTETIISFGAMPIANGFLTPEEFEAISGNTPRSPMHRKRRPDGVSASRTPRDEGLRRTIEWYDEARVTLTR